MMTMNRICIIYSACGGRINVKKSWCIRIGPRNDFGCANIITSTGLTWVRVSE